jgi:translation initiation factor 1 (eIF-1/SUI1)
MHTVSPVTGSRHEVMVQGKQVSVVLEMLGNFGVPKKWIEAPEMADRKKK